MNRKWKKKAISKKITAMAISAAILLGAIIPATAAQTGEKRESNFKLVPVSLGQRSESGYVPAIIPADRGTAVSAMADELPAKFDLRSQNRATPVRDQNPHGTCWAFGALGSAESSMLTKGFDAQEYAVRHLAYFTYHNGSKGDSYYTNDQSDLMKGGNDYMSTGTLARWSGAQLEENAPYPHKSITSDNYGRDYALPQSQNSASYAHLQNAIYFDAKDLTGVKSAVYEKGATAISYWAEDAIGGSVGSYYNTTYNSYFTGPDVKRVPNHTVLVVGWDDNFPVEKFSKNARPSRPGAWLIKNSWGSEWGDDGYFWLSYEETTTDMATYFDMEPTSNYDNNYQYDEAGWTGYFESTGDQAIGSNVFTAEGTESLDAVSFYTLDYDNAYAFQIYTGVTDPKNPQSGTPAFAEPQQGYLHDPGYYTIDLDTPVPLKAGEKFSVVLILENLQGLSPLMSCEMSLDPNQNYGIGFRVEAERGQSFIVDEGYWVDTTEYEKTGNLNIKVFTTDASPADKSALNAAIARANGITSQADYQADAWNTMQAALREARAVQQDDSLTVRQQAEVDAAAQKLNRAIDALDQALALADKTALQAALVNAQEKQKEQSYFANWDSVVKGPLDTAKLLNEDATLTRRDDQKTVDDAAAALQAALKKLAYKPADKTALTASLSKHADKQESKYTAETWAAFQAAFEKAEAVRDNAALNIKDQAKVDAATAELEAAAAALILKPADKTSLQALVEQAEGYAKQESLYTAQTLQTLQEKIDAAKLLLKEDLDVNDEPRIRAASTALEQAIENLKYLPAQTEALVQKLDEARSVLSSAQASGHYTDATVSALSAAVSGAQALLDKEDLSIVHQAQVDQMVITLTGAMNLELKPADKEALSAKVQEVKGFVQNEYESGWADFAKALADANKLLADTSLTIEDQAHVDNALAALTAAAGKLVLKPADTAALQEKANEVKGYRQENYQSGWEEFAKALADANRLLESGSLTIQDQKEIDSALAALTAASAKLTLKDADKAALFERAAQAGLLKKENYTSGWEALEKALLAANNVLADQKLTILDQQKVEKALSDLNTAMNGLVAKAAEKAALQAKVDEVKNFAKNDYQSGWDDFAAALSEAKKLLADNTLTILDQPKVNAALETLRNAAGKLTLKAADKEALRAKVELVRGLTESNYQSGWEAFAKALSEAEKILADENLSIHDQAKVGAALTALNEAADGLVLKAVDKAALEALIAANNSREKGFYSEETWNAFTGAMDAAKEAVQTAQTILDQPVVDAAADRLQDAVAGLKVLACTEDGVSVAISDGKIDLAENTLNVKDETEGDVFEQAKQAVSEIAVQMKAVTLFFTDAEGNVAEPDGGWGVMNITLPLPENFAADRTVVYALSESGEITKLSSSVSDGKVFFDAQKLGTYILVEQEQPVEPEPEDPVKPEEPSKPSGEGNKPTTGDAPIAGAALLCGLSAAALFILKKGRKNS